MDTVEAGIRRGLRGSRVLKDLRQAGYTGSRSAFYDRWAALVEAGKSPETLRGHTLKVGQQLRNAAAVNSPLTKSAWV